MSAVEIREVRADEAGMRLDRWFKSHFPALGHGALQKLLRTGQVRVDGARARASLRLQGGEAVRVPPAPAKQSPSQPKNPPVSADDMAFVKSLVLYRDDDLIAINKPAGLAVQGGSKTEHHLDGMLEALRYKAPERPRLVHRLDRDTSGVLVLARNRASATALGKAFKSRHLRKIYWGLVAGVPRPAQGKIDLDLVKAGRAGDQRVRPAREGDLDAQNAVTLYHTIEHAGRRAAWLALWPRTGRTHQLRAHLVAIGHPILGDGKYGGEAAFAGPDAPKRLQLHARELILPRAGKPPLTFTAPLPDHMVEAFALFGFSPKLVDAPDAVDPFDEVT